MNCENTTQQESAETEFRQTILGHMEFYIQDIKDAEGEFSADNMNGLMEDFAIYLKECCGE